MRNLPVAKLWPRWSNAQKNDFISAELDKLLSEDDIHEARLPANCSWDSWIGECYDWLLRPRQSSLETGDAVYIKKNSPQILDELFEAVHSAAAQVFKRHGANRVPQNFVVVRLGRAERSSLLDLEDSSDIKAVRMRLAKLDLKRTRQILRHYGLPKNSGPGEWKAATAICMRHGIDEEEFQSRHPARRTERPEIRN